MPLANRPLSLQVQTSVDDKEILWIKESYQYGEHPPDSPTTAARKHTRERLAERARRSDSDYSDLESQSLPASELKRQTKSFQLTLDTIRTGESHTETGALTAEEKLRRRQAILICADLVSSIVEDALRAAQRKKSLAWKLLPRDFLSGASLRQTYTWPDRTRYEERTLFYFLYLILSGWRQSLFQSTSPGNCFFRWSSCCRASSSP